MISFSSRGGALNLPKGRTSAYSIAPAYKPRRKGSRDAPEKPGGEDIITINNTLHGGDELFKYIGVIILYSYPNLSI